MVEWSRHTFGELKITNASSEDSDDDIPLMEFLKKSDPVNRKYKTDRFGNSDYESVTPVTSHRKDRSSDVSHLNFR